MRPARSRRTTRVFSMVFAGTLSACLCAEMAGAVDTTPPPAPVVTDQGASTSSTTTLAFSMTNADPESGIAWCEYLIRQDALTGATIASESLPCGSFVSIVREDLVLRAGKSYFIGARAQNGAGLWSPYGYSDGIQVIAATEPLTITYLTVLNKLFSPNADGQKDEAIVYATLSQAADWSLIITMRGAGAQARTFSGQVVNGQAVDVIWNGLSDEGEPVANGYYDYVLSATAGTGSQASRTGTIQVDTTAPVLFNDKYDPPTRRISFALQTPAHVLLRIDTLGGQFLRYLLSAGLLPPGVSCPGGVCPPGSYAMVWDGRDRFGASMPLGDYRYKIWAFDDAGNGSGSVPQINRIFQLSAPDTQAPQLGAIGVTGITASGATISWTTDEPATSEVDYGLTTGYGTTRTDATRVTAHSLPLTGLAGASTYHFRVRAQDASGNTAQSGDQAFQTLPVGVPSQPSAVTIDGRQLLLQKRLPEGTLAPAAPYVIRGVDWSPAGPTTPGGGTAFVRRPEFGKAYQTDLPLMKAMNVNTLRTFMDLGLPGDSGVTVSGLQILDECYRNGIMVIMTVDDGNGRSARVSQAVNYYKNHPAILAWSLGSEWNINLFWEQPQPTPEQAAQRIETEAATVKSLDANHPVISSYGEFDLYQPAGVSILQALVNRPGSKIDIWSFNLYRGDTFGDVWRQWLQLTGGAPKPMFIAEYGIDAWHATQRIHTDPPGAVNEAEQAQWNRSLWDDIARHLSAVNPSNPGLGGTVFEWNDEWWKAASGFPSSQETSGWFSDGFPDGMGNEEYYGLLTIGRAPRQAYGTMQAVLQPGYVPPPLASTITVKATSRGANAEEWGGQYGVAQLFTGNALLFARYGGGGGGRGVNAAAFDAASGQLRQPAENFDLYYEAVVPARDRLAAFVDNQPNGTILAFSVADTSGTTAGIGCTASAYFEPVLTRLEALGSTLFRNYCFRGSWALIAVKGEGRARAESVNNAPGPNAPPVAISAPVNLTGGGP